MAEGLKLVIFDMDDVLFHLDREQRLANLAQATGLPSEQIHAAIWASGFDEECDAGLHDAEACLRGVCERLGRTLSAQEWIRARVEAMTPNADVWRLVGSLQGRVTLATLTNNNQLLKRDLPSLLPMLRLYFGGNFLTSSDFRLAKPDPALFVAVVAHLGHVPEETLFVDDSAEYVEGAREAGLHVHHFTAAEALERVLSEWGLP